MGFLPEAVGQEPAGTSRDLSELCRLLLEWQPHPP
jgi:hypothetical protein